MVPHEHSMRYYGKDRALLSHKFPSSTNERLDEDIENEAEIQNSEFEESLFCF